MTRVAVTPLATIGVRAFAAVEPPGSGVMHSAAGWTRHDNFARFEPRLIETHVAVALTNLGIPLFKAPYIS